jgi:signal transduction histidine kinase
MIKLSHQLRNSLTGIIGYLQLLSNKFYETEEEMMSDLQYAEQSVGRNFHFVSDIVDCCSGTRANPRSIAFVTTKLNLPLSMQLKSRKKHDRKKFYFT